MSDFVPHPIRDAIHLCVDMQNIFAPGGLWATPWMGRVTPNIVALADKYPERNVFTRFITPISAEDRPGTWQTYFRKWHKATRSEVDAQVLELIPELLRFVPPAVVFDKPGYSAFVECALGEFLVEKRIGSLIVSGAETDVCVLATVMGAVDRGFKIYVVEDAVCSSSDTGHDALMTMYRQRFAEQIEVMTTAAVHERWKEE